MSSSEAIFVEYSNTSKAFRVFNKSTLTIEESIHVNFEESNSFVKNVVEIDSYEELEKISMKGSQVKEQEDKPKDSTNDEVQDVEVEPTQPLPKDQRYFSNHPNDLIIDDVSKG